MEQRYDLCSTPVSIAGPGLDLQSIDLVEQKPLYDRPLQSQGGDTVEAHRRGEPRNLIHFRQRSVGLDGKDTHGSDRRVERVEELAIAADRDVEVRGVFRIACDDRGRGQRGQGPALADRNPEMFELPAFDA